MRTAEITWGEDLTLRIARWEKRTERKKTDLFKIVADVAECSANSVGNVRDEETAPDGKPAQRAYWLLTAMEEDPGEMGVGEGNFPDHVDLVRKQRALRELLIRTDSWTHVLADEYALASGF